MKIRNFIFGLSGCSSDSRRAPVDTTALLRRDALLTPWHLVAVRLAVSGRASGVHVCCGGQKIRFRNCEMGRSCRREDSDARLETVL